MSLLLVPDFPFPPSATAGLVGAFIGAAAGSLGTVYSQQRQAKLDTKRDQRTLRDAKCRRIREAFLAIEHTARVYSSADSQLRRHPATNETSSERLKRFNDLLVTEQPNLDRAITSLRLEADSNELLEGIVAVAKAFHTYIIDYQETMEGRGEAGRFERNKKAIDTATDELNVSMRDMLVKLETPI